MRARQPVPRHAGRAGRDPVRTRTGLRTSWQSAAASSMRWSEYARQVPRLGRRRSTPRRRPMRSAPSSANSVRASSKRARRPDGGAIVPGWRGPMGPPPSTKATAAAMALNHFRGRCSGAAARGRHRAPTAAMRARGTRRHPFFLATLFQPERAALEGRTAAGEGLRAGLPATHRRVNILNCHRGCMLLMIDNYDSFTFNLVQYFGELGEEVRVVRNDQITLEGINCAGTRPPGAVPGPCSPAEAGICVEAIRHFTGRLPILGVCLGHQAIGAALGKVVRAKVRCTARPAPSATTGERLCRTAAAVRGHPLPLAGDRARSLPAVLRDHLDQRRRRDHGVRHRELAATATPLEGAVPSRVHPQRAWTCPVEELPADRHAGMIDLRSDTVTNPPRRCAVSHGEPRSATTSSVTTRPSTRCSSASPTCWVRGRRCSCRPARRATWRPDEPLPAWRRIPRRPDGAHLLSLGRRRRGARQHPAATAAAATRRRHRAVPTSRPIKPDDPAAVTGCWRWRTRGGAVLPHAVIEQAEAALARHRRRWPPPRRRPRLFNAAAVASGMSARSSRGPTASRSASAKGLGARAGSRAGRVEEPSSAAHRVRKMLGGGMRYQAGGLAAAGAYALDHHIDRLAEDHAWPPTGRKTACKGRQGHGDHLRRATSFVDLAPAGRRRRPSAQGRRAATACTACVS